MDFGQLRRFQSGADPGGSPLSQPAISPRIKRLEEVGAALIERHGRRGIRLTPAGRAADSHRARLREPEGDREKTPDPLRRGASGSVEIGAGAR